jgi:GT2 family glycosyltransferase
MPHLAIIIVSWNTCDLLARCVATVHASLAGSGIGYRVVVVDNGSSDGTPELLRQRHPEVCLIESGRNLGFAGGNNLGLRRALEERPPPDYLLLLNPDTEVAGDALPRLVAYLETHPQAVAVGPMLRYPDGAAQPSRRRFPSRATFFWESTPLAQRWPANPWARRYRMDDRPDNVEQPVDWLVGAALLVRRAAVERAGLLDAGFTMYSEELEWQRRLCGVSLPNQTPAPRGAPRWPIVYLPDALIIHHEGQSSAQVPAWRLIQFQRSRLRDARMTYGAPFADALLLFLLAAYSLEWATEAAKWLLGHKRSLRAGRLRVYAEVLAGLRRS